MPISMKHGKEISRFISGKSPEHALELLEQAQKMKIAIPFRGEIPHRKGMMSGRYPITALSHMIKVLKSAIANASIHGIDIENSALHSYVNNASRPFKRGGSERFKRTHVIMIIKEITKSHGKKDDKN